VHRTCGCTVRSPHYRTCGEKKLKFFFCPFSSLFDPFPRDSFPRTKTIFFLRKKKWQKRVIDEECLHQLHRRPADLCRPYQRTTIDQYQKWRPTIIYIISYIILYMYNIIYTIQYILQIHYILYCIHNIVTETTVGGHQQTHVGQGLLVYHQGVSQGAVLLPAVKVFLFQ